MDAMTEFPIYRIYSVPQAFNRLENLVIDTKRLTPLFTRLENNRNKTDEKEIDTNAEKHHNILLEANELVHGDRNAAYGHPAEDFARTAAMWTGYLQDTLSAPITVEDVAQMMILLKASRIRNSILYGLPRRRDNGTDQAGYAECWWWSVEHLGLHKKKD
jgi:hypothetical protein